MNGALFVILIVAGSSLGGFIGGRSATIYFGQKTEARQIEYHDRYMEEFNNERSP